LQLAIGWRDGPAGSCHACLACHGSACAACELGCLSWLRVLPALVRPRADARAQRAGGGAEQAGEGAAHAWRGADAAGQEPGRAWPAWDGAAQVLPWAPGRAGVGSVRLPVAWPGWRAGAWLPLVMRAAQRLAWG
jgi:hypothetical protein